jgi:Flp pilus assembly pilin Flp
MTRALAKFVQHDDGQDLIEYAFLAAFIALVVLLGIQAVGTAINTRMSNIASTISSGS